jgi:hypothetical protein
VGTPETTCRAAGGEETIVSVLIGWLLCRPHPRESVDHEQRSKVEH